jgi:hypothetical protein
MCDQTLCNQKGSVSSRNSEAASELPNKDTLAHDHDDWLSSNASNVTPCTNTGVLIVDWDGPDDPSNPKK